MVHIWAVKLSGYCKALSWRSLWSSPQDWRHHTPTKSSPSRDVPLQKAVILEGDYSSLVLRDQLLGCFCQYCMRGTSSAARGDLQFVVIYSLSQLG